MMAKFLNVDLEITSKRKLDVLAADMGERVFVLYLGPANGRNLLSVEIARYYKNPDTCIHALCAIIEKLSPAARRIWNFSQKHFDIGCELPPQSRLSQLTLRCDTMRRLVALGATLTVTHYYGGTEPASLSIPPAKTYLIRAGDTVFAAKSVKIHGSWAECETDNGPVWVSGAVISPKN